MFSRQIVAGVVFKISYLSFELNADAVKKQTNDLRQWVEEEQREDLE